MPRFAILEHRWREIHWDFLLESGNHLRTWAIDAAIVPGLVLPARQLPDHRLAYLDYEGPISGERGSVTRWSAGVYESLESTEDRVVVRLDSDQLKGDAELSRVAGDDWSFFLPGKLD